MTKSEYREYIQSADWQDRRRQFLIQNEECFNCGIPRWVARILYDQELNIHHLHYASLGCETPADVRALCRRCHEIETFGRSSFKEIPTHPCVECEGPVFDPYLEHCTDCSYRLFEDYVRSSEKARA